MANRPVNLTSLVRGGLLLALLVFPSLAVADISVGYGNSLGGGYQLFTSYNAQLDPLRNPPGSSVDPVNGPLTQLQIEMAGGWYDRSPQQHYGTEHQDDFELSVAAICTFSTQIIGQLGNFGETSITNVATGDTIQLNSFNMVSSYTGIPDAWGGAATISSVDMGWPAGLQAELRLPAGRYRLRASTGMPSPPTHAAVVASVSLRYLREDDPRPRPITVSAGSASKEYDGAPLVIPQPAITAGRLMFAHRLNITGATTSVGPAANSYTTAPGAVSVEQSYRGTIIDFSPFYVITLANGSGVITARPITVTLAGSKYYDGTTASTGASASITSGSLAPGDVISYSFANTGSVASGSYTGLVTATITNPTAPNDRTSSYAITYAGSYTINPVVPVMTQLELKTTTGRCAQTAQARTPWPPFPAPWAYLARAGVRMVLGGQSAEDGVRDFEVQVLEPGLDEGNEQNWTRLASVDASPAGAVGRPVPAQTAVASVQIGRTRADEGLAGDGSGLIPSPSSLALYEGLDVTTSRPWTIRARCRAATSNLWSPWRTSQVNVGLPLAPKAVALKTVPTPGTEQWFEGSQQSNDVVYIWLP